MADEPVHEGRTAAAIEIHIDDLGPSVICNPQELHRAVTAAIAAITAEVEAVVFTMHSRRFICEADGPWLDVHGDERSVLRIGGEVDADYAQRLKAPEDKLTRPAILGAVNEILDVGTARMEEWFEQSCYSDIQDTRGFSETCSTHSELRGFTIYISAQTQSTSDRAFALLGDPFLATPIVGAPSGTHCFAGDDAMNASKPELPLNAALEVYSYADDINPAAGAIYPRIWNEINRLRAGGLGPSPHFSVEIE